jgi:hypothetical protein
LREQDNQSELRKELSKMPMSGPEGEAAQLAETSLENLFDDDEDEDYGNDDDMMLLDANENDQQTTKTTYLLHLSRYNFSLMR